MMKRKGIGFMGPVLAILLLTASAAQGTVNNPGAFFEWGGITYITNPDGKSAGYALDLGLPPLPNPSSLGGLTVQVTGPNGFSQTYADDTPHLYSWMGWAEIWQEFPGLAPGLYTFTVSDGEGNRSTRKELVSAPQLMPVVDVATLQWSRRSNGGYRFTWRPVGSEKPYYYRVTIIDAYGDEVFSGTRKFDSAEEIPPGRLTDGAQYQVRVEVHDAPTFDLLNNRSNSEWVPFTPAAADYDPNRVLVNYAFMANRYVNSQIMTDLSFGIPLANPAPLTSATVKGPNGYFYDFDLTADRLKPRVPATNSTEFTKQWTTPLTPGPYLFEFVIGGVVSQWHVTLPPAAALPVIDESTLQARMLGDGATVRFSWADPDHTGALYYRVMIQDSDGKFYASSRLSQTFIDVPVSLFSGLNSSRQWRVDLFDSSSGMAVRNRRSVSYRPLVIQPFEASAPEIASCQIAHITNFNGAHQTYLQASAMVPGSITGLIMRGPNGFTRDMLARNGYREDGSPLPGVYSCTVTDGNGKSSVVYNYQPAAHTIPPVDLKSVNIGTNPSGGLQISWAPVPGDLPLWYAVEFFRNSRVDGKIREEQFYPPVLPASYFLQQTSLTIPADGLPQEPFSMRIFAYDGGHFTTFNNYSRSLTFGYQGTGFDYGSLTDSDGDGYASNINPQPQWSVTVQTSGSGSGAVHSAPQGIACASDSSSGCSAVFSGSSVTLSATPDAGSTFAGWQGACASQGATCTVSLTAVASVTALFDKAAPVRLFGSTTSDFSTIASAYSAASSGNTIKLRGGEFGEAPNFNRTVRVKIVGGYDASFSSAAGASTLHGPVRVSGGTVTVERIAVH